MNKCGGAWQRDEELRKLKKKKSFLWKIHHRVSKSVEQLGRYNTSRKELRPPNPHINMWSASTTESKVHFMFRVVFLLRGSCRFYLKINWTWLRFCERLSGSYSRRKGQTDSRSTALNEQADLWPPAVWHLALRETPTSLQSFSSFEFCWCVNGAKSLRQRKKKHSCTRSSTEQFVVERFCCMNQLGLGFKF